MYMEIVAIEKKTFEEMVAKFDRFVHRMDVVWGLLYFLYPGK